MLILINKRFKSIFWTKLKVIEFISELINPCEYIIILFFIEMNNSFKVIHISIIFEQHFLRI